MDGRARNIVSTNIGQYQYRYAFTIESDNQNTPVYIDVRYIIPSFEGLRVVVDGKIDQTGMMRLNSLEIADLGLKLRAINNNSSLSIIILIVILFPFVAYMCNSRNLQIKEDQERSDKPLNDSNFAAKCRGLASQHLYFSGFDTSSKPIIEREGNNLIYKHSYILGLQRNFQKISFTCIFEKGKSDISITWSKGNNYPDIR
ncbi:hypothetical protein [Deinococcus aquaticus]|uniref:Ig-like domain-containing protein n=1 Tax=Deinococcus aquaticus TaxID=328692 RepID=A0ABY7V7V5_9DEIO|nr:hypothetical protein [Deinococcus aquaticus]WDA60804.1 hypothetical protein M8445_18035 [Deinococcus aquaticus]